MYCLTKTKNSSGCLFSMLIKSGILNTKKKETLLTLNIRNKSQFSYALKSLDDLDTKVNKSTLGVLFFNQVQCGTFIITFYLRIVVGMISNDYILRTIRMKSFNG
jgi:hypothetical protein